MNKEFIKFISQKENFEYVNSSQTVAERERRKLELRKRFDAGFSSVANFSAAVGNPDTAFFDDEANGYPPYDGLQKVRRVVEDAKAKQDAITYAESRNKAIRAGRERARRNLSKPFEYNQHGTK